MCFNGRTLFGRPEQRNQQSAHESDYTPKHTHVLMRRWQWSRRGLLCCTGPRHMKCWVCVMWWKETELYYYITRSKLFMASTLQTIDLHTQIQICNLSILFILLLFIPTCSTHVIFYSQTCSAKPKCSPKIAFAQCHDSIGLKHFINDLVCSPWTTILIWSKNIGHTVCLKNQIFRAFIV